MRVEIRNCRRGWYSWIWRCFLLKTAAFVALSHVSMGNVNLGLMGGNLFLDSEFLQFSECRRPLEIDCIRGAMPESHTVGKDFSLR